MLPAFFALRCRPSVPCCRADKGTSGLKICSQTANVAICLQRLGGGACGPGRAKNGQDRPRGIAADSRAVQQAKVRKKFIKRIAELFRTRLPRRRHVWFSQNVLGFSSPRYVAVVGALEASKSRERAQSSPQPTQS